KDRLSDITQLVHAIREVANGGSVIDPHVVDLLMAARGTVIRSRLEALTPREETVLGYLAQGMSNGAIATQLHTTGRPVQNHISPSYAKLDIGGDPDVGRGVKAALLFLAESVTPSASETRGAPR